MSKKLDFTRAYDFKPDASLLEVNDTVEVIESVEERQPTPAERKAAEIDEIEDGLLDQLLAVFDNYVIDTSGTKVRLTPSANDLKVVLTYLKDKGMLGVEAVPEVQEIAVRHRSRRYRLS